MINEVAVVPLRKLNDPKDGTNRDERGGKVERPELNFVVFPVSVCVLSVKTDMAVDEESHKKCVEAGLNNGADQVELVRESLSLVAKQWRKPVVHGFQASPSSACHWSSSCLPAFAC